MKGSEKYSEREHNAARILAGMGKNPRISIPQTILRKTQNSKQRDKNSKKKRRHNIFSPRLGEANNPNNPKKKEQMKQRIKMHEYETSVGNRFDLKRPSLRQSLRQSAKNSAKKCVRGACKYGKKTLRATKNMITGMGNQAIFVMGKLAPVKLK